MKNLIEIHGIINQTMWENFLLELNEYKNNGRNYGIITNSIGGEVKYTNQIIHLIQNTKMPSITKGLDRIESCALYIYLQGFYRICLSNSEFLIHRHKDKNNQWGKEPTEGEIMYFKMISSITNQPIEKIISMAQENNGQGTKFYAKEAVDMGFVHNVVRYEKNNRLVLLVYFLLLINQKSLSLPFGQRKGFLCRK